MIDFFGCNTFRGWRSNAVMTMVSCFLFRRVLRPRLPVQRSIKMASDNIFQLCETWNRARFDLSPSPHRDDAIPQWGVFRGVKSLTLLGINPGGDSSVPRNPTDETILPVWEDFQREPTLDNFLRAQRGYAEELQRTTYWDRHEMVCGHESSSG